MKLSKRITSVFLCLCIMMSFTVVGSAKNNEDPTSYPFVFVHGMMGWGENTESKMMKNNYWGFSEDNNVPEYLRSLGYEVCVPSVGAMSSAWDRACELYAQLTGTVVDYGAAHSAEHHHARYGRDYTGRPIMEGGWNVKDKINLVSHSFGGPTVNIFTSVLEYGAQEEIEAAPEDCSEFFKGGHEGVVYSVSTLASPHNGSPLANLLYDTVIPVYLVCAFINIMNPSKLDFMMDQYGLNKDPVTGAKAKFSIKNIISLATNDDHDGYDMTIKGARELNAKYPPAKHTYYFSYSGDITDENIFGGRRISKENSNAIFKITGSIIIACSGKYIGGEKLGKEWANNDGFVPVVSAQYPFGQPHDNYVEGMNVEKGVWYVMPTTEGGSHGYHVAGSQKTLYGFYDRMIEVIKNTAE